MKILNDAYRKLVEIIFCTFVFGFLRNVVAIDASIDYEVEGDGFHRTIRYRVDLGNFYEKDCYLAIHFSPDPTLYVNIDELADLARHGEITACSEGEIDVELFAEKAQHQNITTCAVLRERINILSLPIHQRYQLSRKNNKYVNITLPEPILLLGCKNRIKEHAISDIDLCSPCVDLTLKWRQIPYKMKTRDHIWMVPVGDLSDLDYVTNTTLVTVCFGTIIILRALWFSKNDNEIKSK